MIYSKLLKVAKAYQKKAYCPYSNYPVGAALLTKSGKIYGGANVENPAYSATMCAERVALYHAFASGVKYYDVVAFLVITDTKSVAKPCGPCLQVMNELLQPKTTIFLTNNDGKVVQTTMKKLLPLSFTLKDLKSR